MLDSHNFGDCTAGSDSAAVVALTRSLADYTDRSGAAEVASTARTAAAQDTAHSKGASARLGRPGSRSVALVQDHLLALVYNFVHTTAGRDTAVADRTVPDILHPVAALARTGYWDRSSPGCTDCPESIGHPDGAT